MHYDLIIVGGGLVGASLAVALRHSTLRIALIDARLPSRDDPRLFAMNDTSCQFLKNLDVWPALVKHATPIRQVHVSHQGQFGAVRLNSADCSLTALGHVIPAYIVESALNEALGALPSITLYRPAILKTLTQGAGLATLTLAIENKERVLKAPLVIAADGTASTVRQQIAMQAEEEDYQQTAIVTRTTLQRSHQGIAYERFNRHGAIAMLPLIGDECATIWTADKVVAAKLMALSETNFLAALQKEFGYRLGRLQKIAQRHHFPLRMTRAEKNVQGSVFLLGNAAHTMHPIAAQGFNLALYEVTVLAEELLRKSVDSIDLNKIYEHILPHQAASMQISHRLSQIFSHPSFLKSCFLQVGMMGLDVLTPLKKKFIAKMIGRSSAAPGLLWAGSQRKPS
jgi:2-octaprenyl-6-methoxyphenol hydroxylase